VGDIILIAVFYDVYWHLWKSSIRYSRGYKCSSCQLNAQLVSLVGGNGAQLLDW
jgi:hypothetical protein